MQLASTLIKDLENVWPAQLLMYLVLPAQVHFVLLALEEKFLSMTDYLALPPQQIVPLSVQLIRPCVPLVLQATIGLVQCAVYVVE